MARYCFAWDQNRLGAWGCKATVNQCDGKNEECPFFKTMGEHRESRKKANERLATLPEWQQRAIADQFYGGEMPWMSPAESELDGLLQAAIKDMALLP